MGIYSALGIPAIKVAMDTIGTLEDKTRREESQRNIDLYCDRSEVHLRNHIAKAFDELKNRKLLEPFICLANCQSLMRRVVDEIARPVYSTPPSRIVEPDSAQEAFRALAEECRLDAKLDLACKLAQADEVAWLLFRYVPRLESMVCDVITRNIATPIPDPEDPSRDLGLVYCRKAYVNGRIETVNVLVDDSETFTFFNGQIIGTPIARSLPRLNIVKVQRREQWGGHPPEGEGSDLAAGHLAIQLLTALTLRLHKAQGYRQIVITGDTSGTPSEQPMGEDTAIKAEGNAQVTTLDLATPPDHYLKTIEAITTTVAANHGINRDRLNQKNTVSADDVGLLERRAEAIKVFREVERECFEVIRMVSREHPKHRIPESATFKVDFAEIEARVDRKTQLEIRELEERLGLRNRLDDILEDQPELKTIAEARDEYLRNLNLRAWRVQMERALNMPADETNDGPGDSPEENGRKGPEARDNGGPSDEDAESNQE